MVQSRTFGRRTGPPQVLPPFRKAAIPRKQSSVTDAPTPSLDDIQPASLDDELRAWKQARGKRFQMPWRQLSLMAGLCFGIASFVLPASVNDAVQWPLYGLMAMSFYVGLRRRKKSPD